jgi:hypothetical protein
VDRQPDDALALIGKRREAERFRSLLAQTRQRFPALLPWLARRPLRALELAEDWGRLLDIVTWLQAHPRPGIYLRQVDLPGIHSKFIERHKGVLAELSIWPAARRSTRGAPDRRALRAATAFATSPG